MAALVLAPKRIKEWQITRTYMHMQFWWGFFVQIFSSFALFPAKYVHLQNGKLKAKSRLPDEN